MYIEAIKSYPSQNAKLRTQQGVGTHMKTDIFSGKMWYGFKRPGEPFVMAGFPIEVVRDILAQNKAGVEPEVDLNMVDEVEEVVKTPDYENVVGQDDLTRFDSKTKGGKKRGRGGRDRRDRRDRPQSAGSAQGQRERAPRPEGPASGAVRPAHPDRGPRPEGKGGDRNRRNRGRGRRSGDRPAGGEGPPKPPST
jgi:hypothetical protein